MGNLRLNGVVILVILQFIAVIGEPIVPALFIFGDSAVDVGNNNELNTIVKSNFAPYGRDFVNQMPTGRFSNGKLATDFIAETIGFKSYQQSYQSINTTGLRNNNQFNGANFASASSGYHSTTPRIYGAISLREQLDNFIDYKKKLAKTAGQKNATRIISRGVYLISAGSSDFLENYYINQVLYRIYTPKAFANVLSQQFGDFVQKLYWQGARKIGVTSLPPMGCLPAAINIYGDGTNTCVNHINDDAITFNEMLNSTAHIVQHQRENLTVVVFDVYTPLYDIITKPQENGFVEAKKACCGTALLDTSYLCNSYSPGTCKNASKYVFWDGFHTTQATNAILANNLIPAAISLVS